MTTLPEIQAAAWWDLLSDAEKAKQVVAMLASYLQENPWRSQTWMHDWNHLQPTQQLMLSRYYELAGPLA